MYRILIVDDEQIERDALKLIINKSIDLQIELQEAENGREAIVKSKTFKPDIIFMDIKMPGIDGIEAARSIKSESPNTQLVFLTAFNQFEFARDAIQIGAADFLIKPSSEKDLLKIVNSLITVVDTYQAEMNDKKNNDLKLSRASEYLENEFVYAMAVRGINSDKFNNYLSILDLNFHAGRGGIMKIFYESYPLTVETDYQRSILKKRCYLILKKSLKSANLALVSNMELSSIYFMTSLNEANKNIDDDEINKLVCIIEKEIKNELSLEVKIGIGTVFSRHSNSLNSFSHASRELGSYSPVDIQIKFPMYLEVELEKAILKGDKNEALVTFRKITDWFNKSSAQFEYKKQNILELATILKHSSACQDPEGISHEDDSELKSSNSPDLLLTAFQIFLNNLLFQVAELHNSENNSAVKEACKFIENNFNRDIGLEDAAAHCGFSSFYLSRLFKKQNKITFIEYLTNRRLQEAKDLLSNTDLSIKEISRKIGYHDPNYFTRVFKRTINTSPSVYRSKNMQFKQNNPD